MQACSNAYKRLLPLLTLTGALSACTGGPQTSSPTLQTRAPETAIQLGKRPGAEDVPVNGSLPKNIFAPDFESPTLTAEAFTRDYAAAVKAAVPLATVKIEAPLVVLVKVHPTDTNNVKMNLTKTWEKCKNSPGGREMAVKPSVEAIYNITNFINKPVQGEEGADKIIPLVRAQNTDRAKYYDPCLDNLCIIYAVDDPGGIKLLDTFFLERSGIDRAHLKERAIKNLERITARNITIKADGPIFRVYTDKHYEPSLLLSEAAIEQLKAHVQGKLVAAIPNNEELLICGDETPGALKQLREAVTSAVARGKTPVSGRLYIRDQGQWQVFTAFDS